MKEQPTANTGVTAYELERRGGDWLRAARSWMQSNLPNGERVRWNSGEIVTMSVAQFEQAASCIAAAAINEVRK